MNKLSKHPLVSCLMVVFFIISLIAPYQAMADHTGYWHDNGQKIGDDITIKEELLGRG